MQESQRKEIPELHSGNQAVKDLPVKMELYVSHFHGLFTLAQLLWHKKEAFSFTHLHNPVNCPYLKDGRVCIFNVSALQQLLHLKTYLSYRQRLCEAVAGATDGAKAKCANVTVKA